VNLIHEELDFEGDTSTGWEASVLLQFLALLWSLELRSFLRRAAVHKTEERRRSVDEGRSERTELQ